MKKNAQPKSKRDQFAKSGSNSKSMYIIAGVVLLIVVAVGVSFMKSGGNSGPLQPTPEEAKYIGVYLPEGFEPAKLTEPIKYDKNIDMTPIVADVKDGNVTIDAGAVIQSRIVYFEYINPVSQQPISMMAYIKPSGKLFTGVSYCPPCQGKYHHFEADGTLTCNACGTKRDPETEAGISGACKLYPADEMPHKLVDGKIQIAEADLAKWTPQPLDRPVGE